jgi:hypothetical protein
MNYLYWIMSGTFCFRTRRTPGTTCASTNIKKPIIYPIAAARKEDKVDKSLSGLEMYKKYADGRHEGLLEIDPNSAQEFSDWIDGKHPRRSTGGHPWEIKRGGFLLISQKIA